MHQSSLVWSRCHFFIAQTGNWLLVRFQLTLWWGTRLSVSSLTRSRHRATTWICSMRCLRRMSGWLKDEDKEKFSFVLRCVDYEKMDDASGKRVVAFGEWPTVHWVAIIKKMATKHDLWRKVLDLKPLVSLQYETCVTRDGLHFFHNQENTLGLLAWLTSSKGWEWGQKYQLFHEIVHRCHDVNI